MAPADAYLLADLDNSSSGKSVELDAVSSSYPLIACRHTPNITACSELKTFPRLATFLCVIEKYKTLEIMKVTKIARGTYGLTTANDSAIKKAVISSDGPRKHGYKH